MKKTFVAFAFAVLISALSLVSFVSCDKDTDCGLKVEVLKKNTNEPVSDVQISIGHTGGTINASGTTDANGMFEATFHAPAIFDVYACKYEYATFYDTFQVPYQYMDPTYGMVQGYRDSIYVHEERIGKRTALTSVRLKDGETVETTLYLDFNKLEDVEE